jgi:DNA modification methylase
MDYQSNTVAFQRVPIDSLKPYAKILRHHPRSQLTTIRRSLAHYGQVTPILVSATYEIIDGHLICEALKANGEPEVLVGVVNHLTPTQIRGLRLQLNRSALDAVWDKKQLRSEFQDLLELSFDLDHTAFPAQEIEFILNLDMPSANVGEDQAEIPCVDDHPVARLGDIFRLGDDHSHGCGDARDQAFVDRVLGGVKADVCFVDPPYNVKIDGFVSGKGRHRHREFIEGAGEKSDTEFFSFLRDSLNVLKQSSASNALIYACMDWRHVLEMTAAGRTLGLPLINICVWAKTNAGMGSLYRSQHELICIFKAGNEPHRNNIELGRFGRNRSNLWRYAGMSSFGKDRDDLLRSHPTVKPVAMISDAIRDVTKRGDVVLDTFSGSGSVLIAAEETGRKCRACELDPLYVDFAIRRWQKVTGRDAVLERTGERFNDRAHLIAPSPRGLRHGG